MGKGANRFARAFAPVERAVGHGPIPGAVLGLIEADGTRLTYTYDPHKTHTGISALLQAIRDAGLMLKDLQTTQSSLEDIFVSLVQRKQ